MVRVFRARPTRLAFDATLREVVLPELRAQVGIVELWAGRHGPDELGERAIVSTWSSREAMVAAMGDDLDRSRVSAEHLAGTTHRQLDVLPILVTVHQDVSTPPTVLRLAYGRLKQITLATYAEHVHAGAHRDIDRGRGPAALLLAEAGTDSFLTISTWTDWESLAAATGASLDQPVRTRERHELASFRALHYELVDIPG